MRQTHKIKCETQYFQAHEVKRKPFEVRKLDRDYKVGDFITFLEVANGVETGRTMPDIEIIYILNSENSFNGIQEGYGVLGIKYPDTLYTTRCWNK